ncbi:MAG: hypothetical protein ACFCAD_13740 [Pleurocapsa sp.]
MKYLKAFLIIFIINMLIGSLFYLLFPDYRTYLIKEDSLIENLSAISYLSTFFLSSIFLFKGTQHKKPLILIAFLGLLGCLDEISFGERLFKLNMPRINGVKLDSAHDFVSIGHKEITKLANNDPNYLFLLLGIGGIVLATVTFRYKKQLKQALSYVYYEPPFILGFLFILLLCLALLIDLGLVDYYALRAIEELFEMNAALALFFCSFSLQKQRPCKQ